MTQLILDVNEHNVQLPETHKQAYYPRTEDLGVEVSMISGRLTKEVRGTVWRISYQYGYFDDEMKNKVIAACEKGRKQPIACAFLPQESKEELTVSNFFVTSFNRPKFMWSREGNEVPVPVWGDFSVELREVAPHD